MATEEVNKPPPTLPPFPQMILAAIYALDEKTGSSKASISKYIESQYGVLPAGHTTLLTHHLSKMKDTGEIIMVKYNYMLSNPDAPPKRGRGRPPKPKTSSAADVVTGPPRPRGRPPKDPSSVAEKRKVSEPTGRPRGRPKKVRVDNEGDVEPSVAMVRVDNEGDVEPSVAMVRVDNEGDGEPSVAMVRVDNEGDVVPSVPPKVVTGPPKPRGRPPKVQAPFGAVGSD